MLPSEPVPPKALLDYILIHINLRVLSWIQVPQYMDLGGLMKWSQTSHNNGIILRNGFVLFIQTLLYIIVCYLLWEKLACFVKSISAGTMHMLYSGFNHGNQQMSNINACRQAGIYKACSFRLICSYLAYNSWFKQYFSLTPNQSTVLSTMTYKPIQPKRTGW